LAYRAGYTKNRFKVTKKMGKMQMILYVFDEKCRKIAKFYKYSENTCKSENFLVIL